MAHTSDVVDVFSPFERRTADETLATLADSANSVSGEQACISMAEPLATLTCLLPASQASWIATFMELGTA